MIDKYYFDDFQDDNQGLYETMDKKYVNNENKINELIDNKKLIETLKLLKSSNAENLNFQQNETLKNLPTLLLDLQEALKKSNCNVLELKETMAELVQKDKKSKKKIKELEIESDNYRQQIENLQNLEFELKTKIERLLSEENKTKENMEDVQKKLEEKSKDSKAYKRKVHDLESRLNFSTRELEIKEKMINEMNDMIATYKKTLSELDSKNMKYKSNNNLLKSEINNIEDRLKEINYFKDEIVLLQQEVNNLKTKVSELDAENGGLKQKETNYKEENKALNNKLKKLKTDLKSELNEKIVILKELENLKNSQKSVFEKQETLKSIIENTTNKKEEFNSIIEQLRIENQSAELKIKQLLEENPLVNDKYTQLKNKYRSLSLQKQFEGINNEINNKKITQQDVYKISDKYEEEIFNLKCENNLWKNAFIEIARYKLINFEEKNIDQIIQIDRNYIINANTVTREKVDNITSYFKTLVDEENYQANNTKSLKDALISEQEKNLYLSEQLYNEMMLRRKIHNKYMSLRGNLRVLCRLRPFIDNENSSLVKKAFLDHFSISNNTISITNENKIKKFDLDYVFNQKSTQQEVYDEVSMLVQSLRTGNNVCILAYGQTSTGKTYTIQGPGKESPGIAVRAAKEIFEMLEILKNEKNESKLKQSLISSNMEGKSSTSSIAQSKVSISIIEIYNENIYNLLLEGTPLLNIYENSSGNLVVPELNPIIINNFNEARKIFKLAQKLRKTKSTSYNDRSSRSHCIFSFHIKIIDEDGSVTRSKLHIIDLAGSERISKSTITDEIVKKEAISINLSLTALSNVLHSLASRQNHVPYRDSKLTHFLRDSLGENFNILLLLHISPNIRDLNETIYTLDFGTRIAKICKHKTGKEKNNQIDEKSSKMKSSK